MQLCTVLLIVLNCARNELEFPSVFGGLLVIMQLPAVADVNQDAPG